MAEGDELKNFIRFYLDPDLLSEEEAKEELKREDVRQNPDEVLTRAFNRTRVEEIERRGEEMVERIKQKEKVKREKR